MADTTSDSDPDSAAMAEAMGFTGFGMQRASRKRKLTPPSHTGANSAPLGKRRPLNLPQPVASGGGGGVSSNAEEIGLDFDDDDNVEPIGDRGEVLPDMQAQAAGLDALSVNDVPPGTGTGGLPQHHSLPPKPQQQQQQQQGQHHHAGKAPRHPGGRVGGGGPGQVPWWEREWDPRLVDRMVENPWDRLERQRGLGARGTWPTPRGARGGGDDAAVPGGGVGAAGTGGGGGGAMGSPGGSAQAAQTTVS